MLNRAIGGDRKAARKHYEALVEQAAKADGQRPELAKARAFLDSGIAGLQPR